MINVGSFPWEITSIEKIVDKYENKVVFYIGIYFHNIAPEEVQYVKSKGYGGEKFPNSRTEAWSIGLTLLEAATLENSEQVYTMPSR